VWLWAIFKYYTVNTKFLVILIHKNIFYYGDGNCANIQQVIIYYGNKKQKIIKSSNVKAYKRTKSLSDDIFSSGPRPFILVDLTAYRL